LQGGGFTACQNYTPTASFTAGITHNNAGTRNLVFWAKNGTFSSISGSLGAVIVKGFPAEVNAEAGKFFRIELNFVNPTGVDSYVGYDPGPATALRKRVHLFIDTDVTNATDLGYLLCDVSSIPLLVPANSSVDVNIWCLAPWEPGVYYLRLGPAYATLNVT